MTLIPKAQANRRALERIVSVLRAQLAAEVTALNDTGNVVPVPIASAYHMLGAEEDIARILAGAGAACFVYPSAPTQSQDARTGDGAQRGRLDISQYRVVVLFKAPAGFAPITHETYPLTKTEVTWRLADALRGGVINTLHKHAVNADRIHELNVISDLADIIVLNNAGQTGRAVVEVEVWQDVSVPMPTFTL